MDVRTRNSLLKAVFEEIVIHPLGPRTRKGVASKEGVASKGTGFEAAAASDETPRPCGCLVMRLAGVETPLPPVRMRRGYGKDLRLPTVAEWITDVFALAPVEEESASIPGPRLRRTFCSVIQEAPSDTPVGLLAARVLADALFPRRSRGKEAIALHLAQEPLYDGVREHLDEAWTYYLMTERERLRPSRALPGRTALDQMAVEQSGAKEEM